MHLFIRKSAIVLLLVLAWRLASAQDSTQTGKLDELPDRVFAKLDKKTGTLETKLDRQTGKYLLRLEKQETRLKEKLALRDSAQAAVIFGDVHARYERLRHTSASLGKYGKTYLGHLDSLSTAVNFIKMNQLPDASIDKALQNCKNLQSKLDVSEQIKTKLLERRKVLTEQLQRLGMVKELKQLSKQVYYYQAQMKEYKEMFSDATKLEAKLLASVVKIPAFKSFFARNSMLGSLFLLPGKSTASSATASERGLQTRQAVNQVIAARYGSKFSMARQLEQGRQSAQGQLNALRNRISGLVNGSVGNTGDGAIPSFRPNSQKTKSFFHRLEYGANIQSQKARYMFPATSDVGLSLGYKLNDNATMGIGTSYKLGLGSGWNHIQMTFQGIGLRSYLDWKLKGSLYVSGGYEMNYQQLINSFSELRQYSSWRRSGLLGLSRKYSISKSLMGDVKLLWDFLSYQQTPRTQPILFRIGYNLK